jgi:hypothetical protein
MILHLQNRTRCGAIRTEQGSARGFGVDAGGGGNRCGATATRIDEESPMGLNELVPFLGMCTLAAAVYSLACWVGCWF